MFIPYNTDAPLYYWPYATIGLIIANTACFVVLAAFAGQPLMLDLAAIDFFCLQYGVINPLQWFTSLFVHAGIFHLLINMFFLFPFGLIVEGKIGWWKFLAIYFGIGAGESAVEQFVMLGAEGGSLGASAAIYGIMAVAMVWAPKNEINCWFVMRFVGALQWDIPVAVMAGSFILLDLLILWLTFFSMGSSLLHLMGAAAGFGIGVLMVAMRRVDCEGYDMISILQGREGKATPTVTMEAEKKQRELEEQQEREQQIREGWEKISNYLTTGHIDMAISRFNTLKKVDHAAGWSKNHLIKIIAHYQHAGQWDKSLPFVKQYVAQFPGENASKMELNLAYIYIVKQSRPRKGMKSIQAIKPETLNERHRQTVKKLIAQARQMIYDGIIEISDD